MTDNSASTGSKIRAARKAKGWTQPVLAQKISVTKATISRWESSEDAPSGRYLGKLTGVLGLEGNWFEIEEATEPSRALKEEPASYLTDRQRRIGTTLAWYVLRLEKANPALFKHLRGLLETITPELSKKEQAELDRTDFVLQRGRKQ